MPLQSKFNHILLCNNKCIVNEERRQYKIIVCSIKLHNGCKNTLTLNQYHRKVIKKLMHVFKERWAALKKD